MRSSVKIFSNYTLWEEELRFALSRSLPPLKKRARRRCGIGLGNMGIFDHDFSSIPMLLNSSELIFEMSRSAPERTRNKSKQTETTKINIGYSTPFSVHLLNSFHQQKMYPLRVLKCI